MKGLITQLPLKEQSKGRLIYIFRHGQTLLNKEDKIRGWLDIPLDEIGIEEAQDLGFAIKEAGIELDGIYTSDLIRAEQTSLEISKITGIPILGETKILRPWDVGTLSGTDGKKAHEIMSEAARHGPDKEIGGGESFNIFRHRFLVGVIGILNRHRGLKLALTSHSRGERIMHAWIAAGCPDDLSVDLDEFLARGEDTATAQELIIDCPLILM